MLAEWKKFECQNFELRPYVDFSKIYHYSISDQRNINMCVICSFVTILEYLSQINNIDIINFSKNYIYFNCRENKDENSTIGIKQLMKSINSYGLKQNVNQVPALNFENVEDVNLSFSKIYFTKIPLKIKNLRYKLNISPILVFVKMYYQNREYIHAVCFVGYNHKKKYFKYQNSYGKNWNNTGFGRIYYQECHRIIKAVSIEIAI